MTFDVGAVFGEAIDTAFSKTGLLISLIGLVLLGAFRVSTLGVALSADHTAFLWLAVLLVAVATLAYAVLAVGTIRSFWDRELSLDAFTVDLPSVLASLVGGAIVIGILSAAGLALFIVPGLVFITGTYLWAARAVLHDEDFVDATLWSWRTTKGHRWQVFGLIALAWAVTTAVSLVAHLATLLAALLSNGGLATSITAVIAAYVGVYASVFNAALSVEAYRAFKA